MSRRCSVLSLQVSISIEASSMNSQLIANSCSIFFLFQKSENDNPRARNECNQLRTRCVDNVRSFGSIQSISVSHVETAFEEYLDCDYALPIR